MAIEEITRISYFERIKNSFVGIAFGFGLVLVGVVALFWNEGRAVQTERSLKEGASLVVEVPNDRLDPAMAGKLVHITGKTTAAGPLADPELGLEFEGLSLHRVVEMYQWVESSETVTERNTGGSETRKTTYSYAMQWSDREQDSSKFKEPNGRSNPQFKYKGFTRLADDTKVGAFALDQAAVGQLGRGADVTLDQAALLKVQQTLGRSAWLHLQNGAIYLGNPPQNPRLGDHRISYKLLPHGDVSVVGRQHQAGIGAYQTKNGNSILIAERGQHEAKAMFATAQSQNSSLTWIIRFAALFGLILGFGMVLRPLSVLGSVLPFIGSIIGFGTGIIATILGLGIGSVVIAIAWFAYRPILSISVLAVAALAIAAFTYIGRKRRAEGQAAV